MCRSTLNHTDSVWGGCRTLEQTEDVTASSKENNDKHTEAHALLFFSLVFTYFALSSQQKLS